MFPFFDCFKANCPMWSTFCSFDFIYMWYDLPDCNTSLQKQEEQSIYDKLSWKEHGDQILTYILKTSPSYQTVMMSIMVALIWVISWCNCWNGISNEWFHVLASYCLWSIRDKEWLRCAWNRKRQIEVYWGSWVTWPKSQRPFISSFIVPTW